MEMRSSLLIEPNEVYKNWTPAHSVLQSKKPRFPVFVVNDDRAFIVTRIVKLLGPTYIMSRWQCP